VAATVSTSGVRAQDSSAIPAPALEALAYFVGQWESEDSENGQVLGTGEDVRKWAPGKCCLTMVGSSTENGKRLQFAGISGWDAKGKQLIEHWHSTDGVFATIRYPLSGMKDALWSGTVSVVLGDGVQHEGTCTLERTKDGFVFVARTRGGGTEIVRKSIARRVSAGDASGN
jgi:hypothetical protein